MKIGLVCPYNIFKGGGVKEYVLALQKELINRGHTVKVITPWPRSYEVNEPADVIFMGVSRDMKSPFATVVQISATGNGDRVTEVIEQEQFDIINFHEPWIPIISRQILAKCDDVVTVGTFHARLPDTRVSKTIERVITPYTKSILKSLDSLVAVSDSGAHYVSQLTSRPIDIIPNGIDLKKYVPAPALKAQVPTIFYVGRLEKRKGVKYLIRAFAELQQQLPDARLIIGGDGPDREKLEELAEELGVKRVKFLGFISEEEKIEHLQSATVFCSPAMYGESFGIVLLEALACGTPIVAGANPGYTDVLQETGALSLVDPRHTKELARRLSLFLQDKGLADYYTTWGLSYVRQFDYPRIAERYEELFEQLVKSGKKHASPEV